MHVCMASQRRVDPIGVVILKRLCHDDFCILEPGKVMGIKIEKIDFMRNRLRSGIITNKFISFR